MAQGSATASRKTAAPALPQRQVCSKCSAEFRWEPSDPAVKGAPLVARLAKPSDDCDCGYGNVAPDFS